MQQQALRVWPRRRGLPKDDGRRSEAAANVLDRQFKTEGPNQKWVADFTYIWTAEGWLYVAVVLVLVLVLVLDLFSGRAVGWSMQASMTSQLVADALMMAIRRRRHCCTIRIREVNKPAATSSSCSRTRASPAA